jgi:hypothetical protein
MSRWFKALPLKLALAALSIFAAGCGSSSNPAQVRFVNAIQDTAQYGAALDIQVNGTTEFTKVAFQGVQPPSGYTSIPSGGGTFKGLRTGTATEIFIANVSLDPSKQYTLVATGFATGVSKVPIISATDNNTTAASGNVEFRVINASPSGPPGVDIYIIPIGSGTTLTPPATITNLAYKTTSTYAKLPYNPNVVNGANYTMFVTATGTTSPILITQTLSAGSSSAGAIRTLVLTDQENVDQLNQRAIVLNDLN